MVDAAYASKTAHARDVWQQLKAERDAFDEMLRSFQKRTGWVVIYNMGPYEDPLIRGIRIKPDEPIPKGWVKLARNDFLTPDRRRKKAEETQVAYSILKELRHPQTRRQAQQMIGVPMHFYDDDHMTPDGKVWCYASNIHQLGDTVYVTWNTPHVQWDGGEHFERIPLSRYFTAVEEEEARA